MSQVGGDTTVKWQCCNNIDMYMFNQRYCCYSKPILDVADNKYAESAAFLMLISLWPSLGSTAK
jgi:hypothetical protein